ncbi:Na+/H+ antiporter NhaC family protein, partial [Coprococcus comes]|uniref:Na+/H+ antiporter NhaC family protein n=1 Tax=Coprococcus comes TaxID=410072 RepID=UPI001FAC48AF
PQTCPSSLPLNLNPQKDIPSKTLITPFFTGTSWGTYAIVTPICVQMALNISGGALTLVVYATIAAVMGGGCFGDHCSPLSDTTILSSLATGSDHIDHVTAFFNFLLFFFPKCIIFGKSMIFCIKSIVFDKFFIMSYLK